ncbi:ferritin-like domain-containing protein [Desulfosporosinus youngiae]|uniref:Rubrerythrin diiron-binding domain-containing protein n=1 Tax=Desulfosporosinus youngiae DSM 17734 TaxID=768710 RepID=H5Y4U5_9FIRM|nr:ferritin family protein [Desulfosporosinus youngiae]EHQ89831.1 hypothetical protein DesyoDRAFT_2779 [Desulfosporosinus youngiae DSM 17734]
MNPLEFAIKMELDGEQYYARQMEINENNPLRSVCLLMAEDEKKHAEILKNKLNGLPFELTNTNIRNETKNIFADLKDVNVPGKMLPSQLDFYRTALKLEQESINLYTHLSDKAEDIQVKEVFDFLIQQEKYHYETLEELVALISRSEEWVESAEFGIREEY